MIDQYPEGATPAECIAIDVDRHIADVRPFIGRGFDGQDDLRGVIGRFDAACRQRGARVTHIDYEWFGRGMQTIAVANGDGWTCCLAVSDFGVGVLVPRIETT